MTLDYERILLLMAVIHKAADCGMNNMPFVGAARKELESMAYPTPPAIEPTVVGKYGAEQVEEPTPHG